MRTIGLLCTLAACALAFAAADSTATAPPILVVDDDGVQCANADYSSIQDAVGDDDAENGVIRVCPGLYAGPVLVPKSLTIRGDAEAVEAVDCFAPTRPTADPTTQAIVVAPSGGTIGVPAVAFELEADNIELQGFVLPGPTPGVRTSVAHSGYRIHHNLIMAPGSGYPSAAAYFRSSGVYPSRFDHNCLRENGAGVYNFYLPLSNARIDHNSTFRNAGAAFRQTMHCPAFLVTLSESTCSDSRIGMDRVVFDHNISIGDAAGNSGVYWFLSSTSTTAFANTVIPAGRRAMLLYGATYDLHIIDNQLEVAQTAIAARQRIPATPPNIGVLIHGNTVTGDGTSLGIGNASSAGIGAAIDGLRNSWILDNVVTGIAGQGIALMAGNTDNLIRGNTITNNGSDGIQVAAGATGNTFEANQILNNASNGIQVAAGATGNRFEANQILGHGTINGTIEFVDARDDAWPLNVWRGNVCLTDIPHGEICGIG